MNTIKKLSRFEEMINEFVEEHFTVPGCKECHEQCHPILPDDYKGSYNSAIKVLFIDILDLVERK